ncbi:MAG: peptidyl-prolyl cis-trans isomerase [Candidatus Omnitrophota bacterium]
MLKIMRHKGVAKKVLWVISGIIIISFGFGFGMSRYGSKISLTDSAGKAFGKKVSIKEFREKYLDARAQAMMMYGDNFRKVSAMMDLDNEAWTRLLLVKEADRRGIKASDPEVIAYIAEVPFFQRDGEFDRPSYENIIKYSFQREPRAFEEGIRDQIKIAKLFREDTEGLSISDEAVRKEYERRNQKIQVSYTLIDPKSFVSEVKIDNPELQQYFDAHRQDFLEPESVNLSYATFTNATKALAFYETVKSSDDFNKSALAAGAQVKETGFFNMEQADMGLNWPLETLQKAFEAKAGEILKPVKTDSGSQVIKVSEKKPASIPPFDKAVNAIKEKILSERSLALAKNKAAGIQKDLLAKTAANVAFETALTELNLTRKTTPFFALGEYVPEIGLSEDFSAAAFTLSSAKPLSDVVTTSRGPVILHFEALQPVDEKKFADVKKDFAASIYEEQKVSAMNRVIKGIKEKAKLESYIDKIKI